MREGGWKSGGEGKAYGVWMSIMSMHGTKTARAKVHDMSEADVYSSIPDWKGTSLMGGRSRARVQRPRPREAETVRSGIQLAYHVHETPTVCI